MRVFPGWGSSPLGPVVVYCSPLGECHYLSSKRDVYTLHSALLPIDTRRPPPAGTGDSVYSIAPLRLRAVSLESVCYGIYPCPHIM